MRPDPQGYVEEELLAAYTTYDRHVDVVSALQWLFTATDDMPSTVEHFERFPQLRGADGNPCTPDFTIVFKDGSGLAGEVASIALADQSVDDLCRQIARYSALTELPIRRGRSAVSHVDVALLVPIMVGTDVLRRVLRERFLDPAHWYKPDWPPCVIQWVPTDDRYVFQRLGQPENGRLREGDRTPALGKWLEKGDLKTPAERFVGVKAQYAFINDGVDRLYLATHLWTKTFPAMADASGTGSPVPLDVNARGLASGLREQYGPVRANDIKRAMDLLVRGKMAEVTGDGSWRVAWGELTMRPGEADLHQSIAGRAARPPTSGPIVRQRRAERAAKAPAPPPRLFDV